MPPYDHKAEAKDAKHDPATAAKSAHTAEDLERLEYPRIMHRPNPEHERVRVASAEEAREKMKEGWSIHPVLSDKQEDAVTKAEKPKKD